MMMTEQVLWAQLQCQAKEAGKPEEAPRKGFKAKMLNGSEPTLHMYKYNAKVVRDVRKLPKHLIGRYQAPGVPSNPARDVMVAGTQ